MFTESKYLWGYAFLGLYEWQQRQRLRLFQVAWCGCGAQGFSTGTVDFLRHTTSSALLFWSFLSRLFSWKKTKILVKIADATE